MSKALEKVSDYYMDLADEVFPVIQVGAARKATFVLTQGAELRFAESTFHYPGGYDRCTVISTSRCSSLWR